MRRRSPFGARLTGFRSRAMGRILAVLLALGGLLNLPASRRKPCRRPWPR